MRLPRSATLPIVRATRTLLPLAGLLLSCGASEPHTTPDGGGSTSAEPTTAATATTTTTSTTEDGSTSAAPASSSTAADTSSTTDPSSTSGSGASTGPGIEPSSARHTPIPIGTDGAPQGYWEYLPPNYDEGLDPPPPLLIFLHGLLANGDGNADLDKVLETAIPSLIENDDWPHDRPFVVLSPQYGGAQCVGPSEIESFIAWALEHYDVDPTRVYLTAISCGAYGGWRYLAQVPQTQIAATVLISGDGIAPFDQAGCGLARAPIWAFHGDADDTVPVTGTTVPVEGLLQCDPAPDVQMTIYPGVGHNAWRRTYDGSAGYDVFAWMLGYPAR